MNAASKLVKTFGGLVSTCGLLLATVGCVSSLAGRSEASLNADSNADKPNIIIIFTDDQGYGDLGCFGSETIKTPHIDRMAWGQVKNSGIMHEGREAVLPFAGKELTH